MSRIQYRLKKRLYRLKAYRRKGFGIHSPYTFYLITSVIEAKLHYYAFAKLQFHRKKAIELLKSKLKITSADKSVHLKFKQEIKRLKDGESIDRLVFRLLNFSKAKTPVYFGSDFGYTASYMAKVDSRNKITKVGKTEGLKSIFDQIIHEELKISNLENLNFNQLKDSLPKFDFVVVSDSTSAEVLNYLEKNDNKILTNECFLIVLNMYKTERLESFWLKMREKEHYRVGFDLFHMGILIAKEGMQKQNYTRKYRF